METVEISESIKGILDQADGKNLEEKLVNLTLSDLDRRLHRCSERILEFEKKYGMAFAEFESDWKGNKIPRKYSHEAERDYMEWESLADEHGQILSQIFTIRGSLKRAV